MPLNFAVDDSIATITIDRPERMNAMDAEMYEGLSHAWQRVRDDKDIRVAIVTGAGDKSFTTGADLKSYVNRTNHLSDFWLTQKDQILNRGLEFWKPVIAAINGYCLGGGMTLMLATDIRIAAEHATFSVPEVKRGLIPSNGGTQRLIQQVPYAVAMHMLLSGEALSALEAQRVGLINQVVLKEDLLSTAQAYARRLCANGPLALQAIKELAIRSRDVDLATGLRLEASISHIVKSSNDAMEGPRAYAERRIAKFTGT